MLETSNYGYNDEAKLVQRIRNSDSYEPSLEVVATVKDGRILGHGLMGQVVIVNELEKRAKNLNYKF